MMTISPYHAMSSGDLPHMRPQECGFRNTVSGDRVSVKSSMSSGTISYQSAQISSQFDGRSSINTGPILLLHSQYAPTIQVHDFTRIRAAYPRPNTKTKASRISPINTLPPEVLSDIFLQSMQDWNGCSVERLMAVCSLWMHVCLATPSLWTKIWLNLGQWNTSQLHERRSNYVFHHLSRSGILPMRVVLDLSPPTRNSNTLRNNVELAQGVMQLLFNGGPTKKGADTWVDLTVKFKENTPRRLLDFLGISMPSLRSLSLHGDKEVKLPMMNLPSLQSFSRIEGSQPTGFSPSTLSTLTLDRVAFTPDEVAQLSECQNLQSLTLYNNLNLDSRTTKITLPKVTSIEVRGNQHNSSLRFLTLPRLHTVRVTDDIGSLNVAATLRDLAEIRKLEVMELEWLVTTAAPTAWGFSAYTVQQMDALRLEPSLDCLERLLLKCMGLEELEATPEVVKLVRALLKRNAELCPRLRHIRSKQVSSPSNKVYL